MQGEQVPVGVAKNAWWQTPESRIPPRNSMPWPSSSLRLASTSSTASATIELLGSNSSPNASDCITASVRLPA